MQTRPITPEARIAWHARAARKCGSENARKAVAMARLREDLATAWTFSRMVTLNGPAR